MPVIVGGIPAPVIIGGIPVPFIIGGGGAWPA
jgi:hypothetical protein